MKTPTTSRNADPTPSKAPEAVRLNREAALSLTRGIMEALEKGAFVGSWGVAGDMDHVVEHLAYAAITLGVLTEEQAHDMGLDY